MKSFYVFYYIVGKTYIEGELPHVRMELGTNLKAALDEFSIVMNQRNQDFILEGIISSSRINEIKAKFELIEK